MTVQEIEQYFQYHNANIKLLQIGFDNIREQIKALHRKKDKTEKHIYLLDDTAKEKAELKKVEKSLSRILSGIQVSWAEENIKRLFYEKNLFSEDQRKYLIERPALDQKWYETLKITFSIAYDLVPAGDGNCSTVRIDRERRNLGDELVDQYFELREIIKTHLVPNFSIRNKVQHGEWEYAFKPKYSSEFSQDITDGLNHENIITTTARQNLVNTFYQLLVELGRFKSNRFALNSIMTPFEYFYEERIRKIKTEVKKLETPDLNKFIEDSISKQIRGEQHKITKRKLL